MNFRIEAIPAKIADEVRRTMTSPQYQSLKAAASLADGYGPCRSCLRVFEQGVERRIFFTYNSFDGLSSLPDPGPVYIHEENCQRFERGFPRDILDIPVFLEAFGDESLLLQRIPLDRAKVDEQIEGLLDTPGVRFVNLRNAEAGCFTARAVSAVG